MHRTGVGSDMEEGGRVMKKILSLKNFLIFFGLFLLLALFLPSPRTTLSSRDKASSDCANIALDPEIMGLAALPKTARGIEEAVRRCRADMAVLEQLARSR